MNTVPSLGMGWFFHLQWRLNWLVARSLWPVPIGRLQSLTEPSCRWLSRGYAGSPGPAPDTRIQRIAQSVPDPGERQGNESNREPGNRRNIRGLAQHETPIARHDTPIRDGGLNADTEEAETGRKHDHRADDRRAVDDQGREHVRQNLPNKNLSGATATYLCGDDKLA